MRVRKTKATSNYIHNTEGEVTVLILKANPKITKWIKFLSLLLWKYTSNTLNLLYYASVQILIVLTTIHFFFYSWNRIYKSLNTQKMLFVMT
jgi:hypothetical protein